MDLVTLEAAMAEMPLVAILRGVKPEDVVEIATVVKGAGFRMIEVPLNSPDPFTSINRLAEAMGDEVLIGAGTVTSTEQVDQVCEAGGRLIVMPHSATDVIAHAKARGCYVLPGFYTPTEAFASLSAGADGLKMFPADTLGAKGLKAMKAVLPPVPILPVGGVSAENMGELLQAGSSGFGLGSGLYKVGMSVEQVKANAETYVDAYRQLEV